MSGPPTADCLDDDTVAALAEGILDAARRQAVMPHLSRCPRCRAAVASVARALADPGIAREVATIQGIRRRGVYRIALPLAAAAALLLVFAWPRGRESGGHRGQPPAATTPTPIAPVGVVASASPIQWTAVAGADRYRVTLSDTSGRLLYETRVTDTVVSLPDSIVLVPGRSYVWLVEARTGFDRWSTSRLVEFSIAGPASP
jgi:anti-sigma factor RsiW